MFAIVKLCIKMLRIILIIIVLNTVYCCFGQCSPEEIVNLRKTAIVFGERDYKTGALKNTINDAIDIADSLRKLDFYVEIDTNNTLASMSQALDNWYNKLKDYDVALFYFSGHGSQVGDVNYLYPIDANPKSSYDLNSQTYPANEIVEKLSDSSLRCGIIMLDACRSNPFAKSWNRDAAETGLKSMAGRGTFIGFAASPGETASDGKETNGIYQRNGIYTQAILKYITQKDVSLNEIFTKVNNEVRLQTNSQQITFLSSSLNSDFCFNVSYKRRDSVKRSIAAFRQSSSEMVFSPSQDKLYIIDSSRNKLVIKSLNSTNNIFFFKDTIKPFKLANGQRYVYALDSIQKALFIIDPEQNKVKSKFKFLNTPLSFSISRKEKKAYILQDLLNNQTELLSVDLQSLNATQLLKFNGRGNSVITSGDDSKIFITAEKNDSSIIMKFDTRTLRLVDSIKSYTNLQLLAFSTDGRDVYIKSKKATESKSQLIIAKTSSLMFSDTILIDVNSIEVCYDSSYLFICNNDALKVVRLKDKAVTNTIRFSSSPSATATSDNYISYTWLPQEQRSLVKDMHGNLQPIHVLTPDETFQSFLNENKAKHNTEERKRAELIFITIQSSIQTAVQNLTDTLGPSFSIYLPNIVYNNFDYNALSFSMNYGIESSITKKHIAPLFSAKIQDDKLTFMITDEKNESVIKYFSVTKDEYRGYYQDNFIKIIMEFFKERIFQLK